MTLLRLQSIKLGGWGMAAVAKFLNEVDMVMQEIDQDVLDLMQDFLFELLMIHIRDWKPLEAKMEEIHESMPGSEQRTFSYVWSIMRKKIANSTEGVNRAAVLASWQKSNTLMLTAKGGRKDGTKDGAKNNKTNSKAVTKAQKVVLDNVKAKSPR